MIHSDQVNDLFTAIAKAQGEMKAVPFDKKNPHYNSAYASLSATQEMVRTPLAKNNLAIIQSVSFMEGSYFLETRLVHGSGQWISDKIKLIVDRQNMQGLGSAVTYAKRYTLQAILGICGDEDDDGNAASINEEKKDKLDKAKSDLKKVEEKAASKPKNFAPGAQNEPEKSEVTEPMRKRLFALKNNANWSDEEIKGFINTIYGIDSTKDLSFQQYQKLCSILEMKVPCKDAIEKALEGK